MLTAVIDGLVKILGPIATLSKERRELKDASLRAISIALDETCLYYRDLDRGRERSFEREDQLVKYWSAAAISMRHFDENLAAMCSHKSEFWINPDNYDVERAGELGIALDNVRVAYRSLLNPRAGFSSMRR
ncbi:hypothetical protein EJV47_20985 [Hymenobacter gummosus]|uniref:Uncharacterized protein n=2 Tax=Hymenobacter gummosus TaxID=1776032 RepID=A0A431TY34_9BACT|nr:hypothetical protein EJV47_20985 [Hymenobacter gummosus]